MEAYSRSVFINCPYDNDYKGLMYAIIFTVIAIGFEPKLACLSSDSGENRIDKIIKLISNSKYGIHDLSRLKAEKKGDYYRLNMPLELGIDYGCRVMPNDKWNDKKFLILEKNKYDYKRALSDLSGVDIKDYEQPYSAAIMKCVRDWFAETGRLINIPSTDKLHMLFSEPFQHYIYSKTDKLGYSRINYLTQITPFEYVHYAKEWCKENGLHNNIYAL